MLRIKRNALFLQHGDEFLFVGEFLVMRFLVVDFSTIACSLSKTAGPSVLLLSAPETEIAGVLYGLRC